MTWVIGGTTILGYGALISDVQVTFQNGRKEDILQKAYPITNFIAAGFAGSVRIGFMLLQSLSDFTNLPPDALNTHAWDPVLVANNWNSQAKIIFDSAPKEERALGAQLLMVGASPTETSGLGSKIYIIRFSSPFFSPGIMSKAINLCSIGSGAVVGEYKRRLKSLFNINSGILQAEVGNEGGWADAIGFSVSRILNDNPMPGISQHLNVFVVRRGDIYQTNNDETIYQNDGSKVEVIMPRIAQGYSEFQNMAKQLNAGAACAVC